jgi:arabinogalactan endo-1,4-beta-galactosidase
MAAFCFYIYAMICQFRTTLLLCFFLFFFSCKKPGITPPPMSPPPLPAGFAKGADISWLTEMETSGKKFYDRNGVEKDCFQLMKELGMNAIRLRVWVDPAGGWCNTTDVLAKAMRAKAQGMKLMINFHYSDTWADPGQQTKPAAWAGYSSSQLLQAVYDHTFSVLTTLKNNGVIPSWVQVGNETNDGMLWPDGKASQHMDFFTSLLNKGYDAVKAVDPSIQVVVHISNGGSNSLFRWIFDGIRSNGGKWDVTGMSFYPAFNDWQAANNAVYANMQDMILRYNKPVMVTETGIRADKPVEGKAYIDDLMNKMAGLSSNSLGIFYWEPQAYAMWKGYGLGAFDDSGKPTAALDPFKR